MAARGGRRLDRRAGLALAAPARALTFGQTIQRHQRLESTQIEARRLAEEGAPEGAAVVAEEQSAGRGRLGSTFFSPPGGLYVSIVLRPRLEPSRAPLIGLAAGLGLADAIDGLTGLRPVLKWPNDLLLSGRKLSGLLVDLSAGGRAIRYALLGIGVNVNVPEGAFPNELREIATSLLRELGHETVLDELLARVLAGVGRRYHALLEDGARPLLDAWRAAPNVLGRPVRVSTGAEILEGEAQDLDVDGTLLIRLPSGELRRVVAADVHLLRK